MPTAAAAFVIILGIVARTAIFLLLGHVLNLASRALHFDAKAEKLWKVLYYALSEEKPTLLGAMTARAEPQILRLSSIYALLDLSLVISEEHLRAATAVWQYCEDSCLYIFGDKTGDKIADRILDELRTRTNGLTQTDIHVHIFNKHCTATEIRRALDLLQKLNLVYSKTDLGQQGKTILRWLPVLAGEPRNQRT
ncbi:MAG: hypothetical protein AABZ06_12245 [Bdellovibrionota bacterium]